PAPLPIRGREEQAGAPDLDLVAVTERGLADRLAVDAGPVARVQIVDDVAAGLPLDAEMAMGDSRVGDDQVVVLAAAGGHPLGRDLEAGLAAGRVDGEPGRGRGHLSDRGRVGGRRSFGNRSGPFAWSERGLTDERCELRRGR